MSRSFLSLLLLMMIPITSVFAQSDSIEGAYPDSSPHGLPCFREIQLARAYAEEVNKPILLDFTGWASLGSRRMEEEVWVEPEVLGMLQNEFVILSLFTDERTALPESEQRQGKSTDVWIRNVGQQNREFQMLHYGVNIQPFYVIVDCGSWMPIQKPFEYSLDVDEFKAWLEEGLARYQGCE